MERKASSLGYMSDPGRIKNPVPATVKYYDTDAADTDPTTANLLNVWNNTLKYLAMPSTLFPPFVVEVVAISLTIWFLVRFIRGRRQNQQIASAMIASVYAPMSPSFARMGAYSNHKRVQRDLGQLLHDRIGSVPTDDADKAALLFEAGEDVCAAYARVLQEVGTGVWGAVSGADALSYSDFSVLHNKTTTAASQASAEVAVCDGDSCGGVCGADDGVIAVEANDSDVGAVREAVLVVAGDAVDEQRRVIGEDRREEGKGKMAATQPENEEENEKDNDNGWELVLRDEVEVKAEENTHGEEDDNKKNAEEGELEPNENAKSEDNEAEEEEHGYSPSPSSVTRAHTISSPFFSPSSTTTTTTTTTLRSCSSVPSSQTVSSPATSQQHPLSIPSRWLQYITSTRALIETHPYRYYAYASGYVPRVVVSTHNDKIDDHTLLGMHIQFHLQHRHNALAPLLRVLDLNARTDTHHDTITFSFLLPRSAQPLLYVYALAGTESSLYHQYADVQLLAGSPPPLKATFDPKSERNHLFGHVRRYYTYTDTPLLANAPPISTLLTNRLHAVGSATGGDVELLSIYVSDQCREDYLLNGHESVGKEVESTDMTTQRHRNQRDLLGVMTGELQECASVVRMRWRVCPDLDWNRITKFIYEMDDLDGDEQILRVAKAIRRIGTLSLHVAEAFSAFKLPSAIHDANMHKRFDTLKRLKKQMAKNK